MYASWWSSRAELTFPGLPGVVRRTRPAVRLPAWLLPVWLEVSEPAQAGGPLSVQAGRIIASRRAVGKPWRTVRVLAVCRHRMRNHNNISPRAMKPGIFRSDAIMADQTMRRRDVLKGTAGTA